MFKKFVIFYYRLKPLKHELSFVEKNFATFPTHTHFERVNLEQFKGTKWHEKPMVEVVGIEPTSEEPSVMRTTCVALNFRLKAKTI